MAFHFEELQSLNYKWTVFPLCHSSFREAPALAYAVLELPKLLRGKTTNSPLLEHRRLSKRRIIWPAFSPPERGIKDVQKYLKLERTTLQWLLPFIGLHQLLPWLERAIFCTRSQSSDRTFCWVVLNCNLSNIVALANCIILSMGQI